MAPGRMLDTADLDWMLLHADWLRGGAAEAAPQQTAKRCGGDSVWFLSSLVKMSERLKVKISDGVCVWEPNRVRTQNLITVFKEILR